MWPVLAPISGSVPIRSSVDVSVRPPAIVAVDRVDHVRMNGLRSAAVQERRHVARAREVTGLVEPVRVLEVRRGEPELLAPSRSSARRTAATEPWPTYSGERGGGVVRARDERGDREVAHRQLLARAQVDASTRRPAPPAGDTVTTSSRRACSSATSTVISLVMLAGRALDVGRARCEDDRVGAATNDVGRRDDRRRRRDGGGATGRQGDHRERKETATHHTGM